MGLPLSRPTYILPSLWLGAYSHYVLNAEEKNTIKRRIQMKREVENIAKELEITDENGQFMVSSLVVAQRFEKQHKHVLEAIQKIIDSCPSEFTEPNFRPSEYSDSTGRALPSYNLTRTGFSMLAMGFTGKKAFEWRITYIDAFDKMESALLDKLQRQVALTEKKVAALKEGGRKLKIIHQDLTAHLESFAPYGPDKLAKILRGYLAYWAHVDNISLNVAEKILLTTMGFTDWSETGHSYASCRDFISKLINKVPTPDLEKSSPAQHDILLALAEACKTFKAFCWKNVDRQSAGELSKEAANRMIHIFYAELIGHIKYGNATSAHVDFIGRIMVNAELR